MIMTMKKTPVLENHEIIKNILGYEGLYAITTSV